MSLTQHGRASTTVDARRSETDGAVDSDNDVDMTNGDEDDDYLFENTSDSNGHVEVDPSPSSGRESNCTSGAVATTTETSRASAAGAAYAPPATDGFLGMPAPQQVQAGDGWTEGSRMMPLDGQQVVTATATMTNGPTIDRVISGATSAEEWASTAYAQRGGVGPIEEGAYEVLELNELKKESFMGSDSVSRLRGRQEVVEPLLVLIARYFWDERHGCTRTFKDVWSKALKDPVTGFKGFNALRRAVLGLETDPDDDPDPKSSNALKVDEREALRYLLWILMGNTFLLVNDRSKCWMVYIGTKADEIRGRRESEYATVTAELVSHTEEVQTGGSSSQSVPEQLFCVKDSTISGAGQGLFTSRHVHAGTIERIDGNILKFRRGTKQADIQAELDEQEKNGFYNFQLMPRDKMAKDVVVVDGKIIKPHTHGYKLAPCDKTVYLIANPEDSKFNFANDAAYDARCKAELDDNKAREIYEENVRQGVNNMVFLDLAEVGPDGKSLTIVGITAHFPNALAPATECLSFYQWEFWQTHREQERAKQRKAPTEEPASLEMQSVPMETDAAPAAAQPEPSYAAATGAAGEGADASLGRSQSKRRATDNGAVDAVVTDMAEKMKALQLKCHVGNHANRRHVEYAMEKSPERQSLGKAKADYDDKYEQFEREIREQDGVEVLAVQAVASMTDAEAKAYGQFQAVQMYASDYPEVVAKARAAYEETSREKIAAAAELSRVKIEAVTTRCLAAAKLEAAMQSYMRASDEWDCLFDNCMDGMADAMNSSDVKPPEGRSKAYERGWWIGKYQKKRRPVRAAAVTHSPNRPPLSDEENFQIAYKIVARKGYAALPALMSDFLASFECADDKLGAIMGLLSPLCATARDASNEASQASLELVRQTVMQLEKVAETKEREPAYTSTDDVASSSGSSHGDVDENRDLLGDEVLNLYSDEDEAGSTAGINAEMADENGSGERPPSVQDALSGCMATIELMSPEEAVELISAHDNGQHDTGGSKGGDVNYDMSSTTCSVAGSCAYFACKTSKTSKEGYATFQACSDAQNQLKNVLVGYEQAAAEAIWRRGSSRFAVLSRGPSRIEDGIAAVKTLLQSGATGDAHKFLDLIKDGKLGTPCKNTEAAKVVARVFDTLASSLTQADGLKFAATPHDFTVFFRRDKFRVVECRVGGGVWRIPQGDESWSDSSSGGSEGEQSPGCGYMTRSASSSSAASGSRSASPSANESSGPQVSA